jgi:hypothetical protein
MAFSYTVDSDVHIGGTRIVAGTFTSTVATTGGDVNTGMSVVKTFTLTPSGTAVATSLPVYNETLPLTNTDGAVTIVTTTGMIGSWTATGF